MRTLGYKIYRQFGFNREIDRSGAYFADFDSVERDAGTGKFLARRRSGKIAAVAGISDGKVMSLRTPRGVNVMVNSYCHLLGHVVTAVHACKESGELAAVLQKNGFGKDQVANGEKLAEKAERLVRKKVDVVGEDRIREHGVHASCAEVEMWMQTVAFQVKKAVDEESVVELVLADDLHAEDHALTVIAQTLRMMSMMRCDDRVYERLGGEKKTRHLLNRGHALAKKLYRSTDIRLAPEGDEHEMEIFGELEATASEMVKWLRSLEGGAKAAAEKDVRLVGRLGFVPDGVGLPMGGTSYAVVLHEKGQTTPPDPRDVKDCSGWSVGRQGRNRENLGKGWITPEA